MSRRQKARSIRWDEVARLELVVSYETVPERSELDALIELARSAGSVERATFTVTKPSKEELV